MNLRTRLFERLTLRKPREAAIVPRQSSYCVLDAERDEIIKQIWSQYDKQVELRSASVTPPESGEQKLSRGGLIKRDVAVLKGLTLKKIDFDEYALADDQILFHAIDAEDGDRRRTFKMWYEPDCCASCSIEDIAGDLDDLIGTPILMAEEVTSDEPPEPRTDDSRYREASETWTFYKFATIKGSVTIRWYGSSNGWYSEEASFAEIRASQPD